MKKNTVDLVLRFADGQGKIRKNVKIENFLPEFEHLIFQIQDFQTRIMNVDFKLMNGIKTTIEFHLAGIIDMLIMNGDNKIAPKSMSLDIGFRSKIYGLFTELLKLIDAIICDLKSGFEYIDLISLFGTIRYICELYDFAKKQKSSDLTITQEMIIDEKIFELFKWYNQRVSSQIYCMENNNNLIAFNAAASYPHYLYISNVLNSSNYELNVLRKCKFDYRIAELSNDINKQLLQEIY
jgi:hypothetical protein